MKKDTPLSNFICRWFPLPAPEDRSNIVIPIHLFSTSCQLHRDWDYLCYLTVLSALALMLLFSVFICGDLYFGANALMSKEVFLNDHLQLYICTSEIMGPIVLFVSVLFYLRVRLTIDLKNTRVPHSIRADLYGRGTQRRNFLRACFVVCVSVLAIFASHIVPVGVLNHFDLQENLFWIVVGQLYMAISLSTGGMMFVGSVLFLEKAIRFFPELKNEYERMKLTLPKK